MSSVPFITSVSSESSADTVRDFPVSDGLAVGVIVNRPSPILDIKPVVRDERFQRLVSAIANCVTASEGKKLEGLVAVESDISQMQVHINTVQGGRSKDRETPLEQVAILVREIKGHLVHTWETPLQSELAGSVEECDGWLNSLPFGRIIDRLEVSTTTGSEPTLYLKIGIAHLWSTARDDEEREFFAEDDILAYFDKEIDDLKRRVRFRRRLYPCSQKGNGFPGRCCATEWVS